MRDDFAKRPKSLFFATFFVFLISSIPAHAIEYSLGGDGGVFSPGNLPDAQIEVNQGRTQNGAVDPANGKLNYVYEDIKIPQNGGLDVIVNRVYSGTQSYTAGGA